MKENFGEFKKGLMEIVDNATVEDIVALEQLKKSLEKLKKNLELLAESVEE